MTIDGPIDDVCVTAKRLSDDLNVHPDVGVASERERRRAQGLLAGVRGVYTYAIGTDEDKPFKATDSDEHIRSATLTARSGALALMDGDVEPAYSALTSICATLELYAGEKGIEIPHDRPDDEEGS